MKLRNLLFIVLAAIVFCNCQSYQPTSLTVASYNLRNANGSDSARGDGCGGQEKKRFSLAWKMMLKPSLFPASPL